MYQGHLVRFSILIWAFTSIAFSNQENVFPSGHRIPKLSSYPWSAIGLIQVGSSSCTGTLVQKDLVLTAAHCVIDPATHLLKSDPITFLPDFKNGRSNSFAVSIDVVWGTNTPNADAANDWALIRISKPLGSTFGWIETAPDAQTPMSVSFAGYSEDFMGGLTAGVQYSCSLKSMERDYILHDCDEKAGASGGPLIAKIDGKPFIVGINVAEKTRKDGSFFSLGVPYSVDSANIAVSSAKFAARIEQKFLELEPTSIQSQAYHAKQSAVTHTPVRNQEHSGFCWAYTLTAMMEGEAKKQGLNVQLSPEYLGYFHIFLALQNNLSWFNALLQKFPGQLASSELQTALEETYGHLFKSDDLTIHEGNSEKNALSEVSAIGMVPQQVFAWKLQTTADAENFQTKVKNFISTDLFKAENLRVYQNVDANGISEEMLSSFGNSIGGSTPDPSATFAYRQLDYTPKSFVSDYLKFEPGRYIQLGIQQGRQQKALNQIRELLKKDIAVPIVFRMFNDPVAKSKQNAKQAAIATGEFSPRFCDDGKCSKVEDGHVVLAVNWVEDAHGNVNALIIKNSWGLIGRNDRGEITNNASERGFFLLESDYLAQSYPKNAWSILVPREFANQF